MELIPHPSSPPQPVTALTAEMQHSGSGLVVTFALDGDIGALTVPPRTEPARADELWRTTCFELFVRGEGLSYSEFNFSPSGQWAAYWFDSYRSGVRAFALPTPPRIDVEETPTRLTLRVELALQLAADGRIGLSAVIQDSDGRHGYWALAHPEGPPDFHHDACFAAHPPAMAAQA